MNEFPLRRGNIVPDDIGAISRYIESPQYKTYVRDNRKMTSFINALYRYVRDTKDVRIPRDADDRYQLLVNAIRHDDRDKQHSAAWLRMFRVVVKDNETEIAKILFREIPWPIDLITMY